MQRTNGNHGNSKRKIENINKKVRAMKKSSGNSRVEKCS